MTQKEIKQVKERLATIGPDGDGYQDLQGGWTLQISHTKAAMLLTTDENRVLLEQLGITTGMGPIRIETRKNQDTELIEHQQKMEKWANDSAVKLAINRVKTRIIFKR